MKKLIILTFILIVFLGLGINGYASERNNEIETLNFCSGSTAAILYEPNTNKVLYNKEINRRLPPASMTKIMTLLIIYEELEKNTFNKETILTINESCTKVEGSKAFLSVGDMISVDELLKCICIASANDAAIAMAEHISGSELEFVKKMNLKVKELDLKNTNFSDCTGLSSKNHYTSAYDLAVISDELISKYPDVLSYTNIQQDYIRKDTAKPFWLVNTNKMIGRVKNLNGLKTGYTSFSKYCITLHMKQNNMGLISVVFGYENSTKRNIESLELLRYGFANYKLDKIISKGKVLESLDHILYKEKLNIEVEEDLYYLCKKQDNNNYNLTYEYELVDNLCKGKAKVYLEDIEIGQCNIVSNKVVKKNFLELFLSLMKKII